MTEQTCIVCGNSIDNKVYYVKERQLNNGESFRYFYCKKCGTLQLLDKPIDIGEYYEKAYYAFSQPPSKRNLPLLLKSVIRGLITNSKYNHSVEWQAVMRKIFSSLMILYRTGAMIDNSILDVGGGNGRWLYRLKTWGFHDLTCVDRFCDKDSEFSKQGIKFIRTDILDMEENRKYDFITLNHSFEHMEFPDVVLKKLAKLLKEDGLLLIRIPVCGCRAWHEFHENWFQIDAPRHYYLYTEKAIKLLCRRNGLKVKWVNYDSVEKQFVTSALYRDSELSLEEISKIFRYNKGYYWLKTIKVNRLKQGDQAAFYIKKR